MRESSEIVVLTIVETCEARVGRFIYQERSTKQFSPLWRFCEARAGLFNGQETSRKQFSPLGMSCEVRTSLFKGAGK